MSCLQAACLTETIDNGSKKIIILLLLLGLAMILISTYQEKSFPQTIFKYIPKSYYDEMYYNRPITSIFGKMFHNASPWSEAKPGYDQYSPIYSYNHFTKKGAFNFYDNQDIYDAY